MADALVSPAVGGTLWAVSAVTVGYSARRVGNTLGEDRVPLMGVLGAFIFAAQMINFTIPGTGSSGHLGGGLLLAVLLGPHAAVVVMASVLTVQALLFADGGLLALGANITNLAIVPCLIAYPLVYCTTAGPQPSLRRRGLAVVLAAVVGLQLGSLGVVVETVQSGIAELPFRAFALVMQPIHLVIGVVEGFVTAAVLAFVARAEPGLLASPDQHPANKRSSRLLLAFGIAAAVLAGGLSWFASSHPDGLEWAIERLTGHAELPAPAGPVHETLGDLQGETAILPGYSGSGVDGSSGIAGVVGGVATLLLAALAGWSLQRRRR